MEDSTILENQHVQESTSSCEQELLASKERFARLTSDFENYKRRTEKEKVSWMHSAQSVVFADLLSIIDDFERAIAAHKTSPERNDATGFELIYKALQKTLEKYGVTPIADTATFDPEKHESLMLVDSEHHASGEIVQTLQKGFMFKDQVLRPAKVSVAK